MAKAKQCDRCGRYYTEGLSNRLTIRREDRSGKVSTKTIDTCPRCMEAFGNYMTSATYDRMEVKDEQTIQIN